MRSHECPNTKADSYSRRLTLHSNVLLCSLSCSEQQNNTARLVLRTLQASSRSKRSKSKKSSLNLSCKTDSRQVSTSRPTYSFSILKAKTSKSSSSYLSNTSHKSRIWFSRMSALLKFLIINKNWLEGKSGVISSEPQNSRRPRKSKARLANECTASSV